MLLLPPAEVGDAVVVAVEDARLAGRGRRRLRAVQCASLSLPERTSAARMLLTLGSPWYRARPSLITGARAAGRVLRHPSAATRAMRKACSGPGCAAAANANPPPMKSETKKTIARRFTTRITNSSARAGSVELAA